MVHSTGSHEKLTGPTHTSVVYSKLIEHYTEKWMTGADFEYPMSPPEEYPGLQRFKEKPTGCMKDEANHARQVTDTSAINIFFNDEVFKKVVLGENYFKLTGLSQQFVAPEVCPA